jgi:hypothetical protein
MGVVGLDLPMMSGGPVPTDHHEVRLHVVAGVFVEMVER